MIPSLALCLLLTATPAPEPSSEPRSEADRLVEEGAALGQQGRWDEAIARFEAADALFPRAIHACNIGLVHARAGRPEKALLQLSACQSRATEPLPPWVERRMADTRAALVKGAYAPLELVAATPGVHLTIDHFSAMTFTPPITVWLPLGEYHLHAEALGRRPLDETLVIAAKKPQRRVLRLEPAAVVMPLDPKDPVEPDPVKPPEIHTETTHTETRQLSRTPAWVTLGVGVGLLVTSAVFYGLAIDATNEAEGFQEDRPEFKSANSRFQTDRDLAYGFLAGGVVTTAVGVALVFILPTEAVVVLPGPGNVTARFSF